MIPSMDHGIGAFEGPQRGCDAGAGGLRPPPLPASGADWPDLGNPAADRHDKHQLPAHSLAIPNFKWRFVRLMRRIPALRPLAAKADLRKPGMNYASDPRIERVVFICGLHRSGTSMIEDHIHARFDVSALRAAVPENEGQHLQDVYSEERRFGGPGRFALSRAMARELERIPSGAVTRERILSCWRRYVVGDSATLLEKSPANLTKIAWLRATFPGARFIVVVRDPRVVSAATRKWTSASYHDLLLHWQTAHAIALDQADPHDTCFIRYEDFCADPEATLAQSPVSRWLAPRPWPLATQPRFAVPAECNRRYLAKTRAQSLGQGIWDAFGYGTDEPGATPSAGQPAAGQLAG